MNEIRNYCIYEHISPSGKRYIGQTRQNPENRFNNGFGYKYNDIFWKAIQKYGWGNFEHKILFTGLTQEEANCKEKFLIRYYKTNICKYRNPNYGYNNTDGGEGTAGWEHTDEWRRQHSKDMSGENNPMFGINIWDTYSEAKKKSIKNKLSELNSGENNPMFGISPQERMSPDKYHNWYNNRIKLLKSQVGENNPNYGNRTLHNKVKDDPELRIKYYSRPGLQNGRCTKLNIYKDGILIKTFDYIKAGSEWIINELGLPSKLQTVQSAISTAIKRNKPYRGYTFKYEK